jgi:hypothetical protein
MSAFTGSGRSILVKRYDFKGSKRPIADVHRPFRLIGARVLLTDENLGEN